MQIQVVKSKIHRVKVTGADLQYIGSVTIDEDLMDAANIIQGEKVQILNINNGERLETYAIPGPRKSGEITLNGPAARKVAKGDIVIIISYGLLDFEEAKGNNLVADSAVLENSEIIPPCYIGKNVVLKDTVIGPNVSLGEGSKVYDSAISNSLIQSNVLIKNASLDHAMIGHHVHFDGNFTSVSIGDYSILN